jgi:hypothetical protein
MTRLPGFDRRTSRAEAAVFVSLGLLAVTLVTIAVCDGFKFASRRDAIIAVLEGGTPATPLYAGSVLTNRTMTNVPTTQPSASGGKVPARATVSAPQE